MRDADRTMVPEISRKFIWLAFVMLHVARYQWQFQPWAWPIKPLLACSVFAIGWALLRKFSSQKLSAQKRSTRQSPSVAGVVVLGMALGLTALSIEITLRWFNCGEPMELLFLECLWALGVCSSLLPGDVATRITGLISVFLAALLYFIDPSLPVAVCGLMFAAGLVFALLRSYWQRIETQKVDKVSKAATGYRSLVPLSVLLLLLATCGGLSRIPVVARFTSQFSPFSGGQHWADGFAMSGVGDGEALVAASQSAQTEGPVDSEIFVESKKRSLFDVVSDEYGEAKKPFRTKEMNFAVSLATDKMQKNHRKLAQAEKNSATFSLLRQSNSRPEVPQDLTSDALFLVGAAGPLVLKMQTFDTFDGLQWSAGTSGRQTFHAVTGLESNDWYCLKRSVQSGVIRSLHPLNVSVVHLRSSEIPTPPLVEAWSINQVNRSDFYRIEFDRLGMNVGNDVPEFTQVSFVRHGFKLPSGVVRAPLQASSANQILPRLRHDPGCENFRLLARNLMSDLAPGHWQRVERIQQHLQREFRLQSRRQVMIAGDEIAGKANAGGADDEDRSESPLGDFWEKGSGRDYHFATAAAVMLTEAGFDVRLAQGFYVDPQAYDPKTLKSAVCAKDIHTWLELEAEPGVWLPIEATPGYLPTPESLTWIDHTLAAVVAVGVWIVGHPIASLLAVMSAAALWCFRRQVSAAYRLAEWRIKTRLLPDHAVVWTLNWSQHRMARPLRRQAHEPVGVWIERVTGELLLPTETAREFSRAVNRQLYSSYNSTYNSTRNFTPNVCHDAAERKGDQRPALLKIWSLPSSAWSLSSWGSQPRTSPATVSASVEVCRQWVLSLRRSRHPALPAAHGAALATSQPTFGTGATVL